MEYSKEDLIDFLKSCGHNGLCRKILNGGVLIGPIDMKLDGLVRCCGPEEEMEFFENAEDFNIRVDEFLNNEVEGEIFPLVLWFENDVFSIADGNHRFEALKKMRYEKYLCFIWFKDGNNYEEYKKFVGE